MPQLGPHDPSEVTMNVRLWLLSILGLIRIRNEEGAFRGNGMTLKDGPPVV